jgi:hypothetical protein
VIASVSFVYVRRTKLTCQETLLNLQWLLTNFVIATDIELDALVKCN